MRRPRRLPHGESAELVAHLDELRSRLIISGGAVPRRRGRRLRVPSSDPALADTTPTHWPPAAPDAHRHRAVHNVAQGQRRDRVRASAPGRPLAAVGSSRRRSTRALSARSAGSPSSRACCSPSVSGSVIGWRCPRLFAFSCITTTRPTTFRSGRPTTSPSRSPCLRHAAPYSSCRSCLGLVRIRALTSAKLRRNRKIGYMIVACIGVALPGVDPVTTIIETVPLAILFETSIWLAVAFENRWRPATGPLSAGV